jgi:hypothetical protein
LKVVWADGIHSSGLITNQIIEYILRSSLVIGDLSLHNPNVFYELALRNIGLPSLFGLKNAGNHRPPKAVFIIKDIYHYEKRP